MPANTPRQIKSAVRSLNVLYRELTNVEEAVTLEVGNLSKNLPYRLHVYTGDVINLGFASLSDVLAGLRGMAYGLRLTAHLL